MFVEFKVTINLFHREKLAPFHLVVSLNFNRFFACHDAFSSNIFTDYISTFNHKTPCWANIDMQQSQKWHAAGFFINMSPAFPTKC